MTLYERNCNWTGGRVVMALRLGKCRASLLNSVVRKSVGSVRIFQSSLKIVLT